LSGIGDIYELHLRDCQIVASARQPDPTDQWVRPSFTGSAIPAHFARAESSVRLDGPEDTARTITADFDRQAVRAVQASLAADPDAAMEYLYAWLFTAYPDMRSLFPHAMTQTRAAVFGELVCVLAGLDDRRRTERTLAQLAVEHRKFGVRDKHYRPFFDALYVTSQHVTGPAWTVDTAAALRSALDWFGSVMQAAAAADAVAQPAWWTGEIVQHDRRTDTVAVLTIRPDRQLSYEPGQNIQVQTPRWPRIWRSYSVANAPRANGLLDIHVRAVPGGMVSTALVSHCATGDTVLLGAARGEMRVPDDPSRDLVCIAGGTGLAPVKALAEAVVGAAGQGRRRAITLYVGVRSSRDLYDARDLETLRLAYPSLTVITVVEQDPDPAAPAAGDYPDKPAPLVGRLPDAVRGHESFRNCDVYIAGPAGLVSVTVAELSRRVPADRLHHDPIEALRLAMDPPTFEARVHAAGPADSAAGRAEQTPSTPEPLAGPPDPVADQAEG
jgi:NAD(P)H-flavin reductase/hemoglobin-like flavoprotein